MYVFGGAFCEPKVVVPRSESLGESSRRPGGAGGCSMWLFEADVRPVGTPHEGVSGTPVACSGLFSHVPGAFLPLEGENERMAR